MEDIDTVDNIMARAIAETLYPGIAVTSPRTRAAYLGDANAIRQALTDAGYTIEDARKIIRWTQIEEAARRVVRDDCDGTIHPTCWAGLRLALEP